MKKLMTMVVAATFLLTACDKDDDSDAVTESGIVMVNSGSACPITINLDGGKRIAPINYETEKVQPHMVNNRRVSVEYKLRKDFVTPCQDADPAEILEIRAVN